LDDAFRFTISISLKELWKGFSTRPFNYLSYKKIDTKLIFDILAFSFEIINTFKIPKSRIKFLLIYPSKRPAAIYVIRLIFISSKTTIVVKLPSTKNFDTLAVLNNTNAPLSPSMIGLTKGSFYFGQRNNVHAWR
jgi:hypothetical protein